MEKQTIIFDHLEPKKHSVRYETLDLDAAIGTIYVKRMALGNPVPKKIRLTIEEVK